MKTIGMFEAKTHLPEVIRNVQSGEKYILTHRKHEVAIIMSIKDYNKSVGHFSYQKLKSIIKSKPFQSVDEFLFMRDEDRK